MIISICDQFEIIECINERIEFWIKNKKYNFDMKLNGTPFEFKSSSLDYKLQKRK
jgi:hypothetical protein